MRYAAWTGVGFVVGAGYVLLVGMLSVHTSGALAGAVYDWNNELVEVASPSSPIFSTLASALLGGLVFYGIAVAPRRSSPAVRRSVTLGFALSTIAAVIWAFSKALEVSPDGVPSVGIALGWEGWLEQGGTSPAVHLVVVLTLGALWTSGRAREGHDAARSTLGPPSNEMAGPRA